MSFDEHTLATALLFMLLTAVSAGVVVTAAISAFWPMGLLIALGFFVAFCIGRVLTLREIGEDIFN